MHSAMHQDGQKLASEFDPDGSVYRSTSTKLFVTCCGGKQDLMNIIDSWGTFVYVDSSAPRCITLYIPVC